MANDQRKGKGTSREKQTKSGTSKEKEKVDKQSQKKETKKKPEPPKKTDISKGKDGAKKSESTKKLDSKDSETKKQGTSKKQVSKKGDSNAKADPVPTNKKTDSSSKKGDASKMPQPKDSGKKPTVKGKTEGMSKPDNPKKADVKKKCETDSSKADDKKQSKAGAEKSKTVAPSNPSVESHSKKNDSHTKKIEPKKTDAKSEKPSKVISSKAKAPKKPVTKGKKITPALYKTRHNIGRRTAAERVGSYSEAEVALVFPEGYWNPVKVDAINSAHGSDSFPDDNRANKRRLAETEKKKTPTSNKKPSGSKKCKVSPDSQADKIKNVDKAQPEEDSSTEESESDSDNDTSYKASIKKSKKASQDVKVKKQSGKYADLWPRAPRIKRTACLNAGAIMSVMYEKEEPVPKKPKVGADTTTQKPNMGTNTELYNGDGDDISKDSESSSDSDYKPAKVKTEKEQKRKVNLRVKLTAKKLTTKLKDIKKTIVKKKNVKKKVEYIKDIVNPAPVFTPPRRMASLNAQAIWAATKDDRLPKFPKGKSKESPPKIKPKQEDSPKKDTKETPEDTVIQAAVPVASPQPKSNTITPPPENSVPDTATTAETTVTSSTTTASSTSTCTTKTSTVQPGMTSPHVQLLSNMPPGGTSAPKSESQSAVSDRGPARSPMPERALYRTPLPTPSPDVQILEIKPPMASPVPPGFSNIPPHGGRQPQFMQSQPGNMYPSAYSSHQERFQGAAYPGGHSPYPMSSRPQRPYHPQHYQHLVHPHSQNQQSSGYPQAQGQPIYTQPSLHNQPHAPTMYSQSQAQGMFHKAGPESQSLSPRYMAPRMPNQPMSSQTGTHGQHGPPPHAQSGQMMQHMPPFHPRYPAYQQHYAQSRTPLSQTSPHHQYPASSNCSSTQPPNMSGARTPHNPPQIQALPSFPPNTHSTTPVTKPKLEPHGTVSPVPRYPVRTDKPHGYPHTTPVMSTGPTSSQQLGQPAQHHQSQQSHQPQQGQSQQQATQQQQTASHQQQGGESSGGGHDQAHSSSPHGNTCTYPYTHGTTNVPPANHCQPYMVGSVTMETNSGYPVMPFRHYGSAFTVPSFEEAQQIRFGYYQPAGPLIQTVPHDPCCVPHPLGMPVPHPQVKVLVHNAPPGYAADPQFAGMIQAKQSSIGPESSVQSSQDQGPLQAHKVETQEASTSPAKQPKEEKSDRPRKSQDRGKSADRNEDNEKLDIITLGEMDSASMKALSNRQKKSKKSDDKSQPDKRNIKAEVNTSTPDVVHLQKPGPSISQQDTQSVTAKSPLKNVSELIKTESSKKAPPSKVTQNKKDSEFKGEKSKKRKGESHASHPSENTARKTEHGPPKKSKGDSTNVMIGENPVSKDASKQKPSASSCISKPPTITKEKDRKVVAVGTRPAAQSVDISKASAAQQAFKAKDKHTSVQGKAETTKPTFAGKFEQAAVNAPTNRLMTATHALPMTLSAVRPIHSREAIAKHPSAASKSPIRNLPSDKSNEPKVKAHKSKPSSIGIKTTKETKTTDIMTTTPTNDMLHKGRPGISLTAKQPTKQDPKSDAAGSAANMREAVSMIVTGQKDLPKDVHGIGKGSEKCQALDLSSPVKNIPKPKYPVQVDNEPLNLVIHSKSPESTKTASATKDKSRSASVEAAKSERKAAGSIKPRRSSTSQTTPASVPKDQTRPASQPPSSKDAIAKLREIRPMFGPASGNVAIRPKPASTSKPPSTSAISTVMGMQAMQLMAAPRLQLPGQHVTLPVTSQTITIRRPSGEAGGQQRAPGTPQSAAGPITATYALQAGVRTPISAPTLLGIVRPAQPGHLGLVQMQTYPTGLITSANVMSSATVGAPAQVAVARPVVPIKQKPLQPKPPVTTPGPSKTVASSAIKQGPTSVSAHVSSKANVNTASTASTARKVERPEEQSTPIPILPMPAKPAVAPATTASSSTHSVTRTKATIGVANRGAIKQATPDPAPPPPKTVTVCPPAPSVAQPPPETVIPKKADAGNLVKATTPATAAQVSPRSASSSSSNSSVVTQAAAVASLAGATPTMCVAATAPTRPPREPVTGQHAAKPQCVQDTPDTGATKKATSAKSVSVKCDEKKGTVQQVKTDVAKAADQTPQMACDKKDEPTIKKNALTVQKDEPSVKKDAPTIEKDEPTKKKDAPTIEKDEPTKKKDVPTIEKDEPTKKKDAPTIEKDEPTKKKDAPTIEKDEPTKKKDAPTIEKNEPTLQKEEPTVHKDVPVPTIQKDEPTTSIQKDAPTIQKDEPILKKDAPTIQKEETAIQKADTTIQMDEPTIQKNEPTVKKDEPVIQKDEPTVHKVEPTVQKVEPTIQKVEAAVQKVEATVQKVEPTVQNVEPTIQKVEAAVQKVESTVQKVESTIQKIEPTEQKVEPTVENVEPTVENVEATVQKVEPTVQKDGAVVATEIKKPATVECDEKKEIHQQSTSSEKAGSKASSTVAMDSLTTAADMFGESVIEGNKVVEVADKDKQTVMASRKQASSQDTVRVSETPKQNVLDKDSSQDTGGAANQAYEKPTPSNQESLDGAKSQDKVVLPSLTELAESVKKSVESRQSKLDLCLARVLPSNSEDKSVDGKIVGQSPDASESAVLPPKPVQPVLPVTGVIKEEAQGGEQTASGDPVKLLAEVDRADFKKTTVGSANNASTLATSVAKIEPAADKAGAEHTVIAVIAVKVAKTEDEKDKENDDHASSSTDSRRLASPCRASATGSRSSSPRGKLSPDKALMASLTLSNEDSKALDSLILREPVVVLEEIGLHLNASGEPEPSTSTGIRNLSPRPGSSRSPPSKTPFPGVRSPVLGRPRQLQYSPPNRNRKEERRSPSSKMVEPIKKPIAPNPRSRVGVTQAWQWEGGSEWKLVYPQVELPPVLQECYQAVRHFNGDIIRVRDCVLVRSGPRKRDIPYVAKISALWKSSDTGEMMMNVFWYYRPEHTETDRLLSPTIPAEVFASKHRDVIPVACIEDRCYVLTFNEYCRYKSELMRSKEGRLPKSTPVPRGEDEGTPTDRTPAIDANPETVFLCRKVYDVKLKRVLKNPQIHCSQQL